MPALSTNYGIASQSGKIIYQSKSSLFKKAQIIEFQSLTDTSSHNTQVLYNLDNDFVKESIKLNVNSNKYQNLVGEYSAKGSIKAQKVLIKSLLNSDNPRDQDIAKNLLLALIKTDAYQNHETVINLLKQSLPSNPVLSMNLAKQIYIQFNLLPSSHEELLKLIRDNCDNDNIIQILQQKGKFDAPLAEILVDKKLNLQQKKSFIQYLTKHQSSLNELLKLVLNIYTNQSVNDISAFIHSIDKIVFEPCLIINTRNIYKIPIILEYIHILLPLDKPLNMRDLSDSKEKIKRLLNRSTQERNYSNNNVFKRVSEVSYNKLDCIIFYISAVIEFNLSLQNSDTSQKLNYIEKSCEDLAEYINYDNKNNQIIPKEQVIKSISYIASQIYDNKLLDISSKNDHTRDEYVPFRYGQNITGIFHALENNMDKIQIGDKNLYKIQKCVFTLITLFGLKEAKNLDKYYTEYMQSKLKDVPDNINLKKSYSKTVQKINQIISTDDDLEKNFDGLANFLEKIKDDIQKPDNQITQEKIVEISDYINKNSSKIQADRKLHRMYNTIIQLIRNFINNELSEPKSILQDKLNKASQISNLGEKQKSAADAQAEYDTHLSKFAELKSLQKDFRLQANKLNLKAV